MRPTPHPHRCSCGREWDCQNPHCSDLETRWCKLPGCQPPDILRRLNDLETGGHMIHQVAHYLTSQGEGELAGRLLAVRNDLLIRIQQLAEESFAPKA